jgi:hypothetical protein
VAAASPSTASEIAIRTGRLMAAFEALLRLHRGA